MCHFFHSQIDSSCIREFVTQSNLQNSLTPHLPASHRQLQKWLLLSAQVSPCGQLTVSWGSREMAWYTEMENIAPASRVVTRLQRSSFILYLSDLGLGTNAVLTTQGKRLNHTLVSSRVCSMCEVLKFSLLPFFFFNLFYYCVHFRMMFNKSGFSGLAAQVEGKLWR